MNGWLRTIVLSIAALITPLASGAGDAYPTGLDLIKRCHALNLMQDEDHAPDPETVQDYGYCLGFVVGYVSGFAARDAVGEQGMFCPPQDAKIRDFVDAIRNWLVQHPEGLDQLGAYVASQALQGKFPCPSR